MLEMPANSIGPEQRVFQNLVCVCSSFDPFCTVFYIKCLSLERAKDKKLTGCDLTRGGQPEAIVAYLLGQLRGRRLEAVVVMALLHHWV